MPPVLLERDDDVEILIDDVSRLVARGRGGITIIEGPPGVGKTRLLDVAIEAARKRDACVLTASGAAIEHELAFGGVRQLFAATAARADSTERRALFDGPAIGAAGILGVSLDEAPEGSEPMFGLGAFVANLAERCPVVLAVDDLQWLDELSIRFLAYLARRIEGIRVLLIAARRPMAADGTDAVDWPPSMRVLWPRPLSEDATRRLLEEILDESIEPELVASCVRATGGNPFLVVEVARELAGGSEAVGRRRIEAIAPASIGESVLHRIRRLSPAAGKLAGAVALFPNGATVADAAAVAGLSHADAAAAADVLVEAHVFGAQTPLTFEHPVMRSAVYAQLGQFGRRAGHGQAADLLLGRGADVEEVAAHVLASEPSGNASRVDVLEAAADRAERSGAVPAAVRYLDRALEEPPPPDRWVTVARRLGRLQAVAGDLQAVGTLRRAFERAGGDHRVAIGIDLAVARYAAGDFDGAVETLLEVRSDAQRNREQHLTVEALLSHAAWESPSHPALYAQIADALPRDLPGTTPGERLALAQVGARMFDRCEPHERTAEVIQRSLAPSGGLLPLWTFELGDNITLLIHSGRLDDAERLCRERQAEARTTGRDALYASSLIGLTLVQWARGDILSCEADLRLAMELDGGQPTDRGLFAGLLARVCTSKGDLAEARSLLELAIATGGLSMSIAWRRGMLELAEGHLPEAILAWEEAYALHQLRGTLNPVETPWVSDFAEALVKVGRREEGLAILAGFGERARSFGEAQALGIAEIVAGRLADRGSALEHFRRAVAILEPSPYRLVAARARFELGAALRRANQRQESREHLRVVLDYADRHGLEPLARAAGEELLAGGGRPRRRALVGVNALTPSERRIARLAADGMSNREIAMHLFVTVKTVEMHLGRSFDKLGTGSRRELAAVLAQRAGSHPVATSGLQR